MAEKIIEVKVELPMHNNLKFLGEVVTTVADFQSTGHPMAVGLSTLKFLHGETEHLMMELTVQMPERLHGLAFELLTVASRLKYDGQPITYSTKNLSGSYVDSARRASEDADYEDEDGNSFRSKAKGIQNSVSLNYSNSYQQQPPPQFHIPNWSWNWNGHGRNTRSNSIQMADAYPVSANNNRRPYIPPLFAPPHHGKGGKGKKGGRKF